jgi:hypothetical protein
MFATIAVDRSLVNRVVAHAVAIVVLVVVVVVLCERLASSETKRRDRARVEALSFRVSDLPMSCIYPDTAYAVRRRVSFSTHTYCDHVKEYRDVRSGSPADTRERRRGRRVPRRVAASSDARARRTVRARRERRERWISIEASSRRGV